MMDFDPAAKLAESVRALLAGGGIHDKALADAAEADLKKYEAAVSTESESDERGIPILSIDAKLSAFRECLFSEYNTEDALGHAVDLLAFAVQKFCEHPQCNEADARRIIEIYAEHPTEVLSAKSETRKPQLKLMDNPTPPYSVDDVKTLQLWADTLYAELMNCLDHYDHADDCHLYRVADDPDAVWGGGCDCWRSRMKIMANKYMTTPEKNHEPS